MCGITGACWTRDGAPLEFPVLQRMVAALEHRGPDDSGFYQSPADRAGAAALGFRRLSIIDLAGGHQPLSNEDGSVWVVFNGEIYNYRELKPRLEALGHVFRTASDTECIVHAYEQWGPDCVREFRGMFALAIWDEHQRRLFLARDRMGQKPLVYRQTANRLEFASELKSLLSIPGAPRELDPQALVDYVTLQYVPHPKSILRGYRKLPPGHWALFDASTGALRVQRYWQAPFQRPEEWNLATQNQADSPSPETGSGEGSLRDVLTEAVRLRLRSDVPLGAFLSGGIDSTIITGLMQRESAQRIKTFSIGFPVARFDERRYAREAAARLGTEHHEFVVDPSAVDILPKLIWHYDEPFADSSAIPTMYLSHWTRQHVTVALTGDGGDELFAGYDRYQAVELAGRIDAGPRLIRKMLTLPFWQKLPASVQQKSRLRRIKRFLAALDQSPERRYGNWISIFDDTRRLGLFTADFDQQLADYDGQSAIQEAYTRCCEPDMVQRTTSVDIETYLPCDILTKVDIASMAYGLEARSPFMDHRVVELAARMPRTQKLFRGRGKRVLIETFQDLLPDSIQKRPKMGFGVPLDHWFRNELRALMTDTLLDARTLGRGYFEPSAIRQLIDEHTSQRWDHSARLWLLLVFELWHRQFLDAPAS